MKIYTIVERQTNMCEITTLVFINYEKAINIWNKLYKKYKKDCEIAEETGKTEEVELENTNKEEYKQYCYDDGEYYNCITFDTHEVGE